MTRVSKAVISLAIICALFLSGCINFVVPKMGSIALEDSRIDFPTEGAEETVWKGKHMDIKYSIANIDSQVTVSGYVNIHTNVLLSFPRGKTLFVKMNFLDGFGAVLGTMDISPLQSVYANVPESLKFSSTHSIPIGTVSFNFNYYGVLTSDAKSSSEDRELFYSPFD